MNNPSKHNLLLHSGVHYTSQQISLESYQYDLTWIPFSTCCDACVATTDTTRKPEFKSVPHESPTRYDPRKPNKLSCSHFMTFYVHAPMTFMVPLQFTVTQKFLVLSLFSNIWIATSFVSRNWIGLLSRSSILQYNPWIHVGMTHILSFHCTPR